MFMETGSLNPYAHNRKKRVLGSVATRKHIKMLKVMFNILMVLKCYWKMVFTSSPCSPMFLKKLS